MKKEKLIAVLSTAAIITGGSSSSILANGQETIVEDEKVVEKELTKQEKLQQKIDTAKNFLSILDTKEEMVEILNSGLAKDINVYIGDENENKDLKDLSIITFKHKVGNKDMGTIGIIGPKRMNYSKVISIMKYISKKLNDIDKN